MKAPELKDGIPVFTEQGFQRSEDRVYIHMSSEYPDFVGVLHCHKYIEIVYILSRSAKHISVADLADHMFLSRDYCSKLFHSTTGMTVTAFLMQLRVNEACRMLLETEQSINQIARYCGFRDMKHFYSALRSQTGKTPGDYRKDIKQP